MLASLKGKIMDNSGGETICLVTTTITVKTTPTQCPCQGHTYAQIGDCTCNVKPTKSYNRTVEVEVEYDCTLPDDPIEPPTGGGTPGQTGPGGNNPGGGGSGTPGDYTPLNCNPDPNYTVPTIPPPPGTEYILPCSEMDIPTEDPPTTSEPEPEPLTQAEALINWFNTDLELAMHLTEAEQIFLNSHPLVVTKITAYLNSEAREVKEFGRWAIDYLRTSPDVSMEMLDNIYDAIRYQNTTPRDRAPASFYWRPLLTNSDGSINYDNIIESTPFYFYNNGEKTINLEAYNCHYHAFGLEWATDVDDEHPKWVNTVRLNSQDWEVVTGNIKVGDRVMYYKNTDNKLNWTHSARVIEVDAEGYATKVSSKLGTYQIIEHHPRDIPALYGSSDPTFMLNGKATPSRIYWRKK